MDLKIHRLMQKKNDQEEKKTKYDEHSNGKRELMKKTIRKIYVYLMDVNT